MVAIMRKTIDGRYYWKKPGEQLLEQWLRYDQRRQMHSAKKIGKLIFNTRDKISFNSTVVA